MFNFCSLYSGSTGNSFLIKTSNTNLLIDAGVSVKKIIDALSYNDIAINNINAILVTHEHIDHIKSLGILSDKYHIPVYANKKTWDNLGPVKDRIYDNNMCIFNVDETFEIGDIKVSPFLVPHDAAEPCGFNLYHSGKKLSIATDLGHINNNVLKNLEGCSSLLLEANYDTDILKYSSYPYKLKERIAGPNGHLENKIAGQTISSLNNLKNALLIHLSKENNFPELAYKTVCEQIPNCTDLSITVAPRNNPSQIFSVI